MSQRRLPNFMKSPRGGGRGSRGGGFAPRGRGGGRYHRSTRGNGNASTGNSVNSVTFSIIKMRPQIRIGVKLPIHSRKITSIVEVGNYCYFYIRLSGIRQNNLNI